MRKTIKALVATLCLVLCMSVFFACDNTPNHEHKYSELKNNSTEHWYECPDDGEIKPDSKAAHVDANGDGKCDVCEYVMHEHNYSELKSDDKTHWYECPADNSIKPDSKVNHVDENLDGECDVCEHSMNYALAIENKSVNELYVSRTLTLTTVNTPADAELAWRSSNEDVATVNGGIVTAVSAGTATITVSFANVSDTIDVVVKDTIVNTAINAADFDFSEAYQDNAVVRSNGNKNSFVVFNGDASKYYVASATVKLTGPSNDDTWSRIGISHFNGTNSYYGLQLSPGANFNARKTITMTITNGDVQWGTMTDRSQVWGFHNLSAIDFDNVKLTTVRQGNAFYAYINDQLYYADEFVESFDGDTIPVLNVGSASAEFSKMSVSYGETAVSAYLATADNAKFYATNEKTIVNEDGSIKFIGASDSTCSTNAKDHAAKSIGTQAVLEAGVASTIEFDLTIDAFGSRDALPALAVTINRYDNEAAQARSLVIGQYKAGWTGWNSNGDLNPGIGSGGENYNVNGEDARLEEGQTYHVVFTRLMYSDGQDTQLKITDKDGNVLLEHTHNWHDGYTGRVVVNFLSRDLDCTISNIVLSSINE